MILETSGEGWRQDRFPARQGAIPYEETQGLNTGIASELDVISGWFLHGSSSGGIPFAPATGFVLTPQGPNHGILAEMRYLTAGARIRSERYPL